MDAQQIGAVLMLIFGGCVLAFVLRARFSADSAQEQHEARDRKEPVSSPAAKGQFISMGATPQPNLLASTVHRSPVAAETPPVAASPPPTPESSFEVFLASGPRRLAQQERNKLSALVAENREKIVILDPVLATRFHKNTQNELEIFLKAKDIVAALTVRLGELDKLLSKPDWDPAGTRRSWELCYGIVDIVRDPMSALMSDIEAERLTPADCAARLEAIFTRLKKRKTFFRALQKDDL